VVAVLDGLADAVVAASERGEIVYANPAAGELLGWRVSELVGRPLVTLVPPRLQAQHRAGFARYLSTREPAIIGKAPVRVAARRGDGTDVEVELSLSSHDVSSGVVFFGLLRDLRDRVELERERSVAAYLVAMRAIASSLALATDVESAADAGVVAVEALGDALGWDAGAVWVVSGGGLGPERWWAPPGMEEAARALADPGRRLVSGTGLPGRVLATGEPAWIEDVVGDANFPRSETARRFGIRTGVAFPIVADGSVVAVAELFSRAHRRVDVELLGALAGAGGEIGRFLERATARGRDSLVRAHLIEMAQALQASLLPPHPPSVPGIELAARYRAAAGEGEVGGDFFDVFPLDETSWALAVGDVAGRGPRAAALTALARYTIRAAGIRSTTPADVLRVLNEVVRREVSGDAEDERFLTVAYLVLTVGDGTLRASMACGGHPPPLLVTADGEVREIECGGDIIGIFDELATDDCDVELGPGDAVVVFTDGAFEGKGDEGRFGEDRLVQVVRAAAGRPAEMMAEHIDAAITAFLGGGGQDDLALVVVRVPPDDSDAVGGRLAP
jgi:PAS domain S-box-containing protein